MEGYSLSYLRNTINLLKSVSFLHHCFPKILKYSSLFYLNFSTKRISAAAVDGLGVL